MTERFRIVNMGLDGRLIKEDGKIIELERVVDLLNENEQLKIFLEALKEELSLANRDNDALEKENEQLKKEVESKQRVINAYEQYINDLKEDGVLDD